MNFIVFTIHVWAGDVIEAYCNFSGAVLNQDFPCSRPYLAFSIIKITAATVALICLFFHLYVVFAYNYNVDYIKEPIQYLFVSLSVYEALTCAVFIGSFFNTLVYGREVTPENRTDIFMGLFLYFLMASFNLRSSYLVAILLALNRFNP